MVCFCLLFFFLNNTFKVILTFHLEWNGKSNTRRHHTMLMTTQITRPIRSRRLVQGEGGSEADDVFNVCVCLCKSVRACGCMCKSVSMCVHMYKLHVRVCKRVCLRICDSSMHVCMFVCTYVLCYILGVCYVIIYIFVSSFHWFFFSSNRLPFRNEAGYISSPSNSISSVTTFTNMCVCVHMCINQHIGDW